MTKIMIDPDELGATAATLQQCSVELADIGSQLTACVACPMPPEYAQVVGPLVSTVDVILDRLGAVLHDEAIGLTKRALLAAIDSLAAATGSTRDLVAAQAGIDLVALGVAAPPVDTSVLTGAGIVGGSSSAGLVSSGFVGGSMPLGMTIVPSSGPTSSSASLAEALGSGVIGGSWSPGGAEITITPGPPVGTSHVMRTPGNGDLANQMALNLGNNGFVVQRQEAIHYGEYAIHENQAGRTPRPDYDYPG